MCKKKGDEDMDFKDFLKNNKDKIKELTENNIVRNNKNEVVIRKDDPWRDEHEWDEDYKLFSGRT